MSVVTPANNVEVRNIARRRHGEVTPGEAQKKDAEEVVRGSGVNFLGNFGKLSKSLYYVVVTRFVGAEAFGLYTLGWSLIDLVSKFGLFGLDRGVVRFVSQRRAGGEEAEAHRIVGQALTLGLVASLVVAALVWAAAPWAAEAVFRHPELSPILRVLALSIPFIVGSSILLAGLRALRIMRYDVYVRSIAEPFALLIVAVALCALGWAMQGLAFAYLIASICGLLLAVRFFTRIYSPARCAAGVSRTAFRSPLAAFSAPLPLHDALNNLMSRLDLFLLAMFLPASSVGVYAATCEVAWIVKDIRQAVDPIFTPVASRLLHEREKERLSSLLASVARWILTLELAFLLAAGLWGKLALSIFGPAFTAGFGCLVLITAGYVVNGAFGSTELILLMSGRSGLNLLNTFLLVGVNLGLNLFLIPRHGITGAAISAAASLTLVNLLRVIEARVLLGIHPFRRSLLKPIVAAGIAFAAGASLLRLGAPWAWLSALSLPLYFGLLRALGLETGDRELLEKLHRKAPFLRRWADAWDRIGLHLRKTASKVLHLRRAPGPPPPPDSHSNAAD